MRLRLTTVRPRGKAATGSAARALQTTGGKHNKKEKRGKSKGDQTREFTASGATANKELCGTGHSKQYGVGLDEQDALRRTQDKTTRDPTQGGMAGSEKPGRQGSEVTT